MTYKPANPNGQATMANSEPVVIASNQSVISVEGAVTSYPLDDDAYIGTRVLPQSKTRYGFDATVGSGVAAGSGLTVIATGTGQTVSQSGGALVIAAGTNSASETIIRSTRTWTGDLTLRYSTVLTQRNANNNFYIELVDVIGDGLAYTITSATSITVTIPSNPFTAENVGQFMTIGNFAGTGTFVSGRYAISGVSGNDVTFTVAGFAVGTGTCSLFGWNFHRVRYTSTVATNVAALCQRNGYESNNTVTINTTASPGHIGIYNAEDGIATYLDQLEATSTTLQTSVRGQMVRNVPNIDTPLYLQIRSSNAAAAPSATTWTIGFIDIENYVPQQVSLTSVRSQSFNSSQPVSLVNTATVTVGSALPTGGNVIGSIAQITTSIVPGTAAANLGKAEDAVHASGDVGVFILGVSASSATVYTASGDYTPFSLDTAGRLRVHGASAQDAAVGGDVLLVGGRASAAIPTAMSADGDAVFCYVDRNGRSVVTQKSGTATLSNVSGSASSVTVLAANTSRLGATVYNDSTAILYLKFGATASTTSFTVKLQADDYYEVPFGYVGILDGIWASATGSARVTELT